MVRFCKYVFFESKEDFEENVEPRPATKDFYFSGGLIDKIPKTFPITYHYIGTWDTHSCGSWVESNVQDMVDNMEEEVNYLNCLIKLSKNFLTN